METMQDYMRRRDKMKEARAISAPALYRKWRISTLINGKRFWATVETESGTEGEAKKLGNKLFGFSPYADRVKVSPVRSSPIEPALTKKSSMVADPRGNQNG